MELKILFMVHEKNSKTSKLSKADNSSINNNIFSPVLFDKFSPCNKINIFLFFIGFEKWLIFLKKHIDFFIHQHFQVNTAQSVEKLVFFNYL